jgi:integrase
MLDFMTTRRDPFGNILPPRLRWKHGSYHYVVDHRWRVLARDYAEALREWARLEGAGTHARTVAQAAEAWLLERGPALAPKTRRGYESSLRRLLPVFGPCMLDEVAPPDVKGFLKARSAPVSANRDKACMSAVFSFAMSEGWVESNPCQAVARLTEKPRRRTATGGEELALAEIATPLWRALLAVAFIVGARPGELRLLKRSDLEAEGIHIRRPKTGTESLIEWSPALRLAIDAALAAGDEVSDRRAKRRGTAELPIYVFPAKRGKPYTVTGMSQAFAKFCRKAGVQGLQMRDARRTAASEADSLQHAQALLGHTTSAMTGRVYRVRDRVKPVR